MSYHDLSNLAFAQIFNQLQVGLIVVDKDHTVTGWNQWMSRHTHIPAETAMGQNLSALFPEAMTGRLAAALHHATHDGLPSLLSPALHGGLLPLFHSAADQRREKRLQQMTHVLPLRDAAPGAAIIQISDVTANISRERLLRQQAENLRRSTTEDALTGVANRRKFDEVLANEFRKAQLRGTSLALAIADIDNFNAFNLHYGRNHGDHVLAEIASIFRNAIRPSGDLVGRYGGEEFAFILPGLSPEAACQLAEKLRLLVYSRGIGFEQSAFQRRVTVSIGLTVMHPDMDTDTHTLISSADVALYQAKHEGRNQAVYFSITDGNFKACP